MAETLKQKTVKSVIWRLVDVGSSQGIRVVISIFLARLIMPDQFALLAMLTVFIGIADVFIDSGFTSALTRKNNRNQLDCSTVFYSNIVISVFCYILLFVAAPYVADFYNQPSLTLILRILSLQIVISSFGGVQRTLLSAELEYKKIAIISCIVQVISGALAILMAYWNFQVWALVFQILISNTINCILLWFFSKWRPSLQFSWQCWRDFFGFGSKLLASSVLNTAFSNLYTIVIGKIYAPATLAFYNRATTLNSLTSATPTAVLQSVSFPALCKLQDTDDKLIAGYRKMIKLAAYIIFPLSMGLAAIAYPAINVLYTDKWLASAPLLQIICFAGMLYPIHAINLNLLVVKGRSDLFFKLEILKKLLTVIIIATTFSFGVKVMCIGSVVSSYISLVINSYYSKKLFGYGLKRQFRDILPSYCLSFLMFAIVLVVTKLLGNGLLSLGSGIVIGFVIYLGGSMLFNLDEFKEVKSMFKKKYFKTDDSSLSENFCSDK